MKITFHGAAGMVPGSCHLVESGRIKILIDCGLFQGGKALQAENRKEFCFDPKSIDYLILTHGHLDHCGLLPRLHREGFDGEVVSTTPTTDLAELIMLDSAHINNKRDLKHERRRRNDKSEMNGPLYTASDVQDAMQAFRRKITYGKTTQFTNDISATFYNAGHILGSTFTTLEIREGSKKYRVTFSGDLGNKGRAIVSDPDDPPESDIVVMESTYGDRNHKSIEESIEEFYGAINQTFDLGGNSFIPTLAVERAQEYLLILNEGIKRGLIPRDTMVFLDSAMAISATEIFKHHQNYFSTEAQKLFRDNSDPFSIPNLHCSNSPTDSKAINDIQRGAVILAGSGMCNGGRIRYHLKRNLPRPECSFIFAHFAPHGSLARRIIDGAEHVNIFGHDVKVKAKIHTIGGFSAHMGKDELLNWHGKTGRPENTFLVHGSQEALASLAGEIRARGFNTHVPEMHETFEF